ncbi:ATP-binding protein [Desulfoluna sp.]|uniref:ATP-binding protein n=1 Tax=Desulfoluna sp. TaxID=2045199 RepID=UPI0026369142|nr:ATP-binding protein [Desulfoluna sp.]
MQFLARIRRPATHAHLAAMMETVVRCAEDQGADAKAQGHIELALEEALVNIVSYACPDGTGEMEVRCSLDKKKGFVIEILDSGPPFDPLSQGDPDTAADLEDRDIGGLGIFFMKQFMDRVEYFRKNDENILKLTKTLS